MADVSVDALREVVLEFLDPGQGERFAITNRSMEIFALFALGGLNQGIDPARLKLAAGKARDRALASAAKAGSRVRRPGGGGMMPLLREKDAAESTGGCNFSAF